MYTWAVRYAPGAFELDLSCRVVRSKSVIRHSAIALSSDQQQQAAGSKPFAGAQFESRIRRLHISPCKRKRKDSSTYFDDEFPRYPAICDFGAPWLLVRGCSKDLRPGVSLPNGVSQLVSASRPQPCRRAVGKKKTSTEVSNKRGASVLVSFTQCIKMSLATSSDLSSFSSRLSHISKCQNQQQYTAHLRARGFKLLRQRRNRGLKSVRLRVA